MLNASTANNNRAGSFTVRTLSLVRSFQNKILGLRSQDFAASELVKILCKDAEKLKI